MTPPDRSPTGLPARPQDNPCRPRHFRPSLLPAAQDANPLANSLTLSHNRLMLLGFIFTAAFLIVAARLIHVMLIVGPQTHQARIASQTVAKPVSKGRSDIVDRNGVVLATTLDSPSLFANPRLIDNAGLLAHKLAAILPGAKEDDLRHKLTADKSFVWLHRHLTPSQQSAVTQLGVPGLDFEHEERRIYPTGALGSHVVGFTDLDNKGLAGIERSFDAALAEKGEPLRLTIDVRLQAILKEEMQHTIDDFNAVGATGIVLDSKTGEVLSLVSLPDFNPNNLNTAVPETIFNRATLGVYELGSVFKIFNTALSLDSRKAGLNTYYDTRAPIKVGGFTIHDYHPFNRPATVTEIFMESSNIGSARMVMETGIEAQRAFLGSLGLLQAPVIEIPEVGMPSLPNPWREINSMTISYGHGLSVTPLQMAVAANAVINGGILRPATLIKPDDKFVPSGTRVLSQKTSEEMRKLLRLVVTEGTGKNADVPGYLVGGKTGSAEKAANHGYAKKALLSSFVAAFPINDPKYLIYVIIDEPKGNKKSYGFATAGWTAAPAVKRIIARMAPLLGVKQVEETPEIRRAVSIDLPVAGKKIAAN